MFHDRKCSKQRSRAFEHHARWWCSILLHHPHRFWPLCFLSAFLPVSLCVSVQELATRRVPCAFMRALTSTWGSLETHVVPHCPLNKAHLSRGMRTSPPSMLCTKFLTMSSEWKCKSQMTQVLESSLSSLGTACFHSSGRGGSLGGLKNCRFHWKNAQNCTHYCNPWQNSAACLTCKARTRLTHFDSERVYVKTKNN